ncbi:GLPGLI family protein [Mesonia aquimarina]|uniref:GLPGLI family protein n=1 Tax=Mesonia aquimarina TaxID=1504967 RepID=UPI0013CED23A|nr:GLPGLI family protein [Mesonia aquimarina]
MKNIVCFILLVLLGFIVKAQESGEIEFGTEYKSMTIDTSKISDHRRKDFYVSQANNAKMALKGDRSYFKVKFNNEGALTEKIPIMKPDNGLAPYMYSMMTEQLYIENIPYSIRNIGGKVFYVKYKNIFTPWKITDETKSILGYKCRKAITYFNSERIKNKDPIIAWFTEEIPASYGPYRYYGLPGFILEVYELGRRHYARKITLNKKVKIDFPKEEELYTQEEFRNRK